MYVSKEMFLLRVEELSSKVYSMRVKVSFQTLIFSLMFLLPISSWANSYITDKVESIINWGFWAILLGAVFGGIASTFIKTEVDDRLSHDVIAKLLIGTSLGFFASVSYIAYFPETESLKLALPSFVLGCLGAPIVVFLLTWASDPETFKKAGKKLDKHLSLEDKKDQEGGNF